MEEALGSSVGVSATRGEITTDGHASEDSSGHLNSREHRDWSQACSLLVRLSRGPMSLRDHRCVRAHRAAQAPMARKALGPTDGLLCGRKPRRRDQRAAEPGRAVACILSMSPSLTFSC